MPNNTQIKLSSSAKKALASDPRVQELYATWQERELNALEALMLKQIVEETISNQ